MAQNKDLPPEALRRLESERFERRLVSKEKKHAKNRLETIRSAASSGDLSTKSFTLDEPPVWVRHDKNKKNYSYLLVPEELDLVDDFEMAAKFLRAMRLTAFRDRRPVYLVFEHARNIQPAALLLLLAEIHRCRLIHGVKHISGSYPKDQGLERTMDSTGFFKLLQIKSRSTRPPKTYPVEYINFRSAIGLAAKEPRKLRQALLGENIQMELKPRTRLQRALTEAMLNVGHHAYPIDRRREHQVHGRWWLAGQFNLKRRDLMITFCDLGVGIPATLPKKYPMEMIQQALSILPGIKAPDGQMIQAGMVLGRTRTDKVNRGRGLNDLRSFIDQAGAGELHIFSRRGWYRYRAGGEQKIQNFDTSIGATVIKWTVPLDRIANSEGEP